MKCFDILLTNIVVFLLLIVCGAKVTALTAIAVEPIPSDTIVSKAGMVAIRQRSYQQRNKFAKRILNKDKLIQRVILALRAGHAITTIYPNQAVKLSIGGWEGHTNPNYVLVFNGPKQPKASLHDINILNNALGYVLNQYSTTLFSSVNIHYYPSLLNVTYADFQHDLTNKIAIDFFKQMGKSNWRLYRGKYAGFTRLGKRLILIQPAVNKQMFIHGIVKAAHAFKEEKVDIYNDEGRRDRLSIFGVNFIANDFSKNAYPCGGAYLAKIPENPDAHLQGLANLNQLRRIHLNEVEKLSGVSLKHVICHQSKAS